MSKRVCEALLLSAILCSVSAEAVSAAWGVQTTITGYFVYDVGAAYVKVDNPENPDGCVSTTYLILDQSAQNFKYIWAQVIAAQATVATVAVRYNGCIGNYPKIDAVAIPNRW